MASREAQHIGNILRKHINKDSRILDVGCGYGTKMKELLGLGYENVVGVEISSALVDACRTEGLQVFTVDEFDFDVHRESYDLILMSHIIEHFAYQDLVAFIEDYLNCLTPEGLLLIATPVLNPSFYDDFDHVKPYTHVGILNVFGDGNSQVQYRSGAKLKLVDLVYTRQPYQLKFYRALAMRTVFYRIPRVINQLLHLVYRLSLRKFGHAEAWIGLFRKI